MKRHVKRAAISARNEPVQERIPGYAAEAQVYECLEYIHTKGYQLVPELIYSEVASGRAEDRPAVAALLEAARHGEFDVLMVYDHDRLYRSPLQVATLLAAFEQDRVRVESISASGTRY